MHIIEHINTENEWHIGRAKGIGGSDAACILGLNPYKSNIDLWKEKTGRTKPKDISDNPAVKYGKEAEEPLRQLFKLDYPEYEVKHAPFDLHINSDYTFIRASLDAELLHKNTKELGFWECKTSEIKQSSDWLKWDKKIPNNYFCQVLHYFAIDEDYKYCKLKAQLKHITANEEVALTTKHYHLNRADYLDDIKELVEEEIKFWWYVENDKEPPLKLPRI